MMNCRRMEEVIDDYVDSRLAEDDRRDVERHIEECATCKRSLDRLRIILEKAAALPDEIQPPRNLLPGIRRTVEAGGARRPGNAWIWWTGLAASLLILFTAVVTTMTFKSGGGEAAQVTPPPGAILPVSQSAVNELRSAEQEYLLAAELLTDALEKQRGSLSPETAALVDKNLEIINQAIANVQLALNAEPGNTRNGQVLTALYQQKIEILRRVSRLSS